MRCDAIYEPTPWTESKYYFGKDVLITFSIFLELKTLIYFKTCQIVYINHLTKLKHIKPEFIMDWRLNDRVVACIDLEIF